MLCYAIINIFSLTLDAQSGVYRFDGRVKQLHDHSLARMLCWVQIFDLFCIWHKKTRNNLFFLTFSCF